MEIIGTWKAGKILSASDAGETFITVEEFLALPDEQKDDAMALLARSFFSIKQDGTRFSLQRDICKIGQRKPDAI